MTPTKTLLLVEDEALIRHDLKEGLVEAGFDVSDVVSMIALFDVVRSEVFDGLPGSASRAL